ncbi:MULTISPECIES: tripartite tricarboxylate transporter substrate binding protein [Cupriavidus]
MKPARSRSANRARLVAKALACIAVAATTAMAQAQPASYPQQPVRVVVPFPAGGVADMIARLLMTGISQNIRQSILIDNRGGASGSIGTSVVAHSKADGYTLLMVLDTFAINPLIYEDANYSNKDFAPISMVTQSPMVLLANQNLPVKSVGDLARLAKAKPGALNFASVGPGSASHLTAEMFDARQGVKMTHVPYKGGAPAQTALMAGEVDIMWGSTPYALSVVRAGKTKAIAQASKTRSAVFPDLPTTAEQGMPDFEAIGWSGLLAPAGTPPEVIRFWNEQLAKVVQDPKVKKQLLEQGFDIKLSTPDEFGKYIDGQTRMWKKLIEEQHIPVS